MDEAPALNAGSFILWAADRAEVQQVLSCRRAKSFGWKNLAVSLFAGRICPRETA
jgi:hypothetical protein